MNNNHKHSDSWKHYVSNHFRNIDIIKVVKLSVDTYTSRV